MGDLEGWSRQVLWNGEASQLASSRHRLEMGIAFICASCLVLMFKIAVQSSGDTWNGNFIAARSDAGDLASIVGLANAKLQSAIFLNSDAASRRRRSKRVRKEAGKKGNGVEDRDSLQENDAQNENEASTGNDALMDMDAQNEHETSNAGENESQTANDAENQNEALDANHVLMKLLAAQNQNLAPDVNNGLMNLLQATLEQQLGGQKIEMLKLMKRIEEIDAEVEGNEEINAGAEGAKGTEAADGAEGAEGHDAAEASAGVEGAEDVEGVDAEMDVGVHTQGAVHNDADGGTDGEGAGADAEGAEAAGGQGAEDAEAVPPVEDTVKSLMPFLFLGNTVSDGMHIIPIGTSCIAAALLRDMKLRKAALPFDWLVCTPEPVLYYLQKLLERTNTDLEWKDFMDDFLDAQDTTSQVSVAEIDPSNYNKGEWVTGRHSMVLQHRRFPQMIFKHDQMQLFNGDFASFYDKYKRRFRRLKELLLSKESKRIILLLITPHGEGKWPTIEQSNLELLQQKVDHCEHLQKMREVIMSARTTLFSTAQSSGTSRDEGNAESSFYKFLAPNADQNAESSFYKFLAPNADQTSVSNVESGSLVGHEDDYVVSVFTVEQDPEWLDEMHKDGCKDAKKGMYFSSVGAQDKYEDGFPNQKTALTKMLTMHHWNSQMRSFEFAGTTFPDLLGDRSGNV